MKRKIDLLCPEQCNNKKTALLASASKSHDEEGADDDDAMNLGDPFELLPNEILCQIFEQCHPCKMWHRVIRSVCRRWKKKKCQER